MRHIDGDMLVGVITEVLATETNEIMIKLMTSLVDIINKCPTSFSPETFLNRLAQVEMYSKVHDVHSLSFDAVRAIFIDAINGKPNTFNVSRRCALCSTSDTIMPASFINTEEIDDPDIREAIEDFVLQKQFVEVHIDGNVKTIHPVVVCPKCGREFTHDEFDILTKLHSAKKGNK